MDGADVDASAPTATDDAAMYAPARGVKLDKMNRVVIFFVASSSSRETPANDAVRENDGWFNARPSVRSGPRLSSRPLTSA
jgi:hypothetical protein